jgi:signal transduction histidine kinase
MPNVKQRMEAARKVYETYWDCYTKGELETFASTLDETYEMIGTSESEICHTKADGIKFVKGQIAEIVGKVELRNRKIDVVPVDQLMLVNEHSDIYVLADTIWRYYSKIRISTLLRETEGSWKVVQQHGSLPDIRVQEGETMAIEKISRENLELRDAVRRRTIELELQYRELETEAALERIRAQVTAMQESSELLDIVVTMRTEFVQLGHEAHYFWYMRWLPEKYEKAMTSGDGTRIGMIMSLPRHIHGDVKLVADWEKGHEPVLVFAMDEETAVDYVHKMITLGDFEQVDPQAPTLDDIRHIGGLTFVMARTTHGEIGFSLPGVVPNPPKDAVDALVRFAGVFDLAFKRFEDLKAAEKDIIEIKAARQKAEEALTELKATQEQLVQQEKLASLGQLTAGIAHEIQNPLNFVNNFSEVNRELIAELREELENGNLEEVKTIARDLEQNEEKISHHGKRADAIVKGMLQHSRTSSGQKEPTNINTLADEYLRLSYHGLRAKDKSFNADYKTDFDPNLPMVEIIPQDIGRVLLNLINNAFYACAERGRGETPMGSKTSSGLDDYKPTVTVTTKNLGDKIEIRVKDNGNGITEEIKNKIFQPFFTTKPTGQGTGLGLSMSYDIVTKGHGGEIKVGSAEEEGTEFIIYLPTRESG